MCDHDFCLYCERSLDHPNESVPAADDDSAWTAEALDHAPDCEWVTTRAHRRPNVDER